MHFMTVGRPALYVENINKFNVAVYFQGLEIY